MLDEQLTFSAPLWVYSGKSAWHFVTLPEELSAQIKFVQPEINGFGSVRICVNIGGSSWKTSLFPSKTAGSYLLPIKASVRKKEKLGAGDDVPVTITLL